MPKDEKLNEREKKMFSNEMNQKYKTKNDCVIHPNPEHNIEHWDTHIKYKGWI